MKKTVTNFAVFLGLALAGNTAWAGCKSESSACTVSCMNNFGQYSDTSIPAEMQGNRCGPSTAGM